MQTSSQHLYENNQLHSYSPIFLYGVPIPIHTKLFLYI